MVRKCPCGKRPNYNVLGRKPICCSKCKTDDMIDVVHKRCPCGKISPIFNVPWETKGVCCSKCKTGDMIDVFHKRCPCGKTPKFNVPGETVGVCCGKCKTGDMINIVSKRCPCGKQPSFNVPGKSKPICCSNCKTDDMTDIKNKRCPCGSITPIFNVPGENIGVACSKCKTDDMIDIKNKRCPCGKLPVFNVPGKHIGVACSKCKTDDMIDVKNKRCPGYAGECPVRTYIGNGHDYCMSCDPNNARRKQFKRFEEAFFEYVKDKLNIHMREFRVTFDPTETAKKFARLDGVVFGDGVVVCLEVDEDGHLGYECDEHRMYLVTAELLQKYPEHVVSWVRVNPTIDAKSQWSNTSKKIREKRFEDVVTTVNDILKKCDTRVEYIGFK